MAAATPTRSSSSRCCSSCFRRRSGSIASRACKRRSTRAYLGSKRPSAIIKADFHSIQIESQGFMTPEVETPQTTTEATTAPPVYINQLAAHVGTTVSLRGWLYNLRSSGKLLFPQLRDGTGVVQCVVFKQNVAEETWDALKHLGQESALVVRGSVRAAERAPGGFEMEV